MQRRNEFYFHNSCGDWRSLDEYDGFEICEEGLKEHIDTNGDRILKVTVTRRPPRDLSNVLKLEVKKDEPSDVNGYLYNHEIVAIDGKDTGINDNISEALADMLPARSKKGVLYAAFETF